MNLKNFLLSTLIVMLIGSFYFGKVFSGRGAKIIYVNQAAEGENNGTKWENAFTDLQSALASANPGDEIWVAAGLYLPSQINDKNSSFFLKNGVAIYGGFQGSESSRYERNFKQFETILSGDLGFADPIAKDNDMIDPNEQTRADNSFHVVQSLDNDHTAVLDGFIISGGNAVSDSNLSGGGIYMQNSHSQIKNLILKQNAVLGSGAAIYINGGMPSIDSVLITQNVALGDGGGIYSIFGYPQITRVTFSNNRARDGGGATFSKSSSFLQEVVLIGNSATGRGGGIYYYESETNVSIRDASFENNHANNGGGIYNHNSKPTIDRVTFALNRSTQNGGGMFNSGSTLSVRNSTFSGNSSEGYGGAIFNSHYCDDSVFGVCVNWDESALSLDFVTIAFNEAIVAGGGIFNDVGKGDEVNIKGVLLTSNNTSSNNGTNCQNTLRSHGYNFLQNLTDGCNIAHLADAGPNLNSTEGVSLFPLALNGGKSYSHAFPTDSPIKDYIPLEHCTTISGTPTPRDQRMRLRPFNGNCDIGALEWPIGLAHIPFLMLDSCEFCEMEPNGEDNSANGPLITGNTYLGKFPNSLDIRDYYYFEIPSTHRVSVWLTNIGDSYDYDLTIYNGELQVKGESNRIGNDDEEILGLVLDPGRYYILVTNPLRTESDQFYHLTLSYK